MLFLLHHIVIALYVTTMFEIFKKEVILTALICSEKIALLVL